jgi:hypothetical protein
VVLQLLRFSVLMTLVGLPVIVNARTVEENQSVLVSVFNDAGVDDATVLVAEKMVSQIYEQAGLLVVWRNCVSEPGPRRQGCIGTVDNRHLVLHIEHNTQTLGADAYGVAFLGEDGSGSYCDVFYDRIVALYQRGRASEAKILAIIAAHELGHLLLGSHAHSPIGIMRPQLQAKDFWKPEPGGITFTPRQTQRISNRLIRIQAQADSKAHRAGL